MRAASMSGVIGGVFSRSSSRSCGGRRDHCPTKVPHFQQADIERVFGVEEWVATFVAHPNICGHVRQQQVFAVFPRCACQRDNSPHCVYRAGTRRRRWPWLAKENATQISNAEVQLDLAGSDSGFLRKDYRWHRSPPQEWQGDSITFEVASIVTPAFNHCCTREPGDGDLPCEL